jgi:type II secretory pathway pseudopilin PulG
MEIMMVVAIMGLVAAMGMPSIMSNMKKEGMRKAISDVEEICTNARRDAILSGKKTSITFHPAEKKFELDGAAGGAYELTSATLPDSVDFAMLDINVQDFVSSPWAKVFFYPNGTSDEMVMVLLSHDDRKKISLEFSTALTVLSEVNQ